MLQSRMGPAHQTPERLAGPQPTRTVGHLDMVVIARAVVARAVVLRFGIGVDPLR